MRRLDRAAVQAPLCLAKYGCPPHRWADVNALDKAEIRVHLEALQGRLCAYCEGPLDSLGQHVEHFRRKSLYESLTFDWTNLFLSCNMSDSCGHYKENEAGAYNVDDLVNPCIDDPDHFFRFRSDGTIGVRYGLAPPEVLRATETLRVFNLCPHWGRLRNMRRAAVAPYVKFAAEAVHFTIDELKQLFHEELEATKASAFSTAIRHVLTEP